VNADYSALLRHLRQEAAVASLGLADMQPFLDLPALGHAGMNHRDPKVLLQLFDDSQDPELSSLKIDPFSSRMFEKGLFNERVNPPEESRPTSSQGTGILSMASTSNPASVKYLETVSRCRPARASSHWR